MTGCSKSLLRLLITSVEQTFSYYNKCRKNLGFETHSESNKSVIENTGAKALVADVFDREAVLAAMSKAQPEVVIHQLTSLSNRNFLDNTTIRIEGTRNLVDAALALGVERIIAQSISWAYEPGEGPATEDIPLHVFASEPRNTTIEGIVALERAVTEITHHVILRYGMLYGPGTWYDHQGFMAEQILHGKVPATDGVMAIRSSEHRG
jgi:nucleoside-diphosphate-sugar epimerase